ncbi:MAG TPA: hypothetical protein VGJ07_18210, partial [Rugosimonospora sp.]
RWMRPVAVDVESLPPSAGAVAQIRDVLDVVASPVERCQQDPCPRPPPARPVIDADPEKEAFDDRPRSQPTCEEQG